MLIATTILVLLLVVILPFVDSTEPPSRPTYLDWNENWSACRPEGSIHQGCGDQAWWSIPSLPTTALQVLLNHGQIMNVTMDQLYFSNYLSHIPDISVTGRDFYTLLYQVDIPPSNNNNWRILQLAGVNYHATAWLNGHLLDELGGTMTGMFRRRAYQLLDRGGRFNLLILPPWPAGRPVLGQGGNHELAQAGAVQQYQLGWDWCQALPDRNTGFFGGAQLISLPGAVVSGAEMIFARMLDPAIQTLEIQCTNRERDTTCQAIQLRALVHLQCRDGHTRHLPNLVLRIAADWGETWEFSVKSDGDVQFEWSVQQPELVHLWWPHGVGMPTAHLHSFNFELKGDEHVILDSQTIAVGIRTIHTFLDEKLQGQRFQINGRDVYLVGGNWIGTDQTSRSTTSSRERYCHELELHRYAGLNLIRVWGGGSGAGERDAFYSCADELGLLVYQEFWMTGDNNGRWAGNYSWPLNYRAYVANAADCIRRLRYHASVLFYGGCNECLAPNDSGGSPPHAINHLIRRQLELLDPGRFYISSSMGGVSSESRLFAPMPCVI
jgi:mannosylglycoprotein endo-beta-mannosidase